MRRNWQLAGRVLRRGLLVLLCLGGGLLLLNTIDEPLDPGARALLQAPAEAVPRQQNLYYAMLGLGSVGADPEQAGWDEVQVALAQIKAGVDPYRLASHGEPGLQFSGERAQLPEAGDLAGALALARAHPDQAARLLDDNRRIVERYEALYGYTRYADPLRGMDANVALLPRWDLPALGKRLRTLQLARDLPRDGPAALLDWLRRDNRYWRRMIAEDDTGLIGKMVMAAQLRADFMIASQLAHLGVLDGAQLAALAEVGAPLAARERGMQGVWASEFRWSAAALSRVFAEAPMAAVEATWWERLGLRVQKMFYLPNATLNRRYRQALQLMAIDDHPCAEIPAERAAMVAGGRFGHLSWLPIRNPVGATLVDLGGPVYVDYPRRMCDLLGFQRLLAMQLLLRQGHAADADIPALIQASGPEYNDPNSGGPLRWLPQRRALSFEAFGKRERELLPWGI